jgi:PIN domain nuclease of toxin-antitoxin system
MTSNPNDKLPIYVVDTHVLLWYLTADKKLSQTAHAIIKQAINGQANLVIPAVALAELYMIAEKQRTPLVLSTLDSVVKNWQTADNIRLTNLTPELVILSSQFSAIPEIFNRLIATEAHKLGVPLITKDPLIVNSKLVPTLW